MVSVLWICVAVQMTLELSLGGEYVPGAYCYWTTYFNEAVMVITNVQFFVYSSITVTSYISIFVKIRIQQARRRNLGK